jgi:hypothetical protein
MAFRPRLVPMPLRAGNSLTADKPLRADKPLGAAEASSLGAGPTGRINSARRAGARPDFFPRPGRKGAGSLWFMTAGCEFLGGCAAGVDPRDLFLAELRALLRVGCL